MSTLLGLSLSLAAGACTGEISQEVDDTVIADSPRFPRLTNAQWHATVRDLLYLDEAPVLVSELQPDPPLGRFDNNILRLTFSAVHWRSFQRAAEEVADLATSTPSILTAISPADLPAEANTAGRAFIEHFAPRAFRRVLTPEEVDNYLGVFLEGPTHYPEMSETDAGIRMTIEALLQSPHFLYRVEDSETENLGAISLDGYEVASRLSYAFWNTMPSDDLFAAAADGTLDSEAGVRQWAEQMFDDERTSGQFDSFHLQAFEMAEYTDLDKDVDLFPQWSRELGESMLTESSMFMGNEVFGGGGIRELMTSNQGFVNAELAALYGIEGDFGEDFTEVELDPVQRSGMLTRLGFLTRNATLTESDAIHRGVFVNLNLICRPLSAVPELPDELNLVGDTNREQINSLTGPGTCGENCHATLINPIGFALENFDALGQYRAEQGGKPVDAADVYIFEDGREIAFDGALELSERLANSPEVHACYIQQLLEYLLGRDLEQADMDLVVAYAEESVNEGLSIREIILRVVGSRSFRYRALAGGTP
jgi:hypothetical protein